MTLRIVRNLSFVALLAVGVFGLTTERLQAASCYDVDKDVYSYTIWYWGCGWYWEESDPCEDGTFEDRCWDDCQGSPFNTWGGELSACESSGPPYWVSWAECICYN